MQMPFIQRIASSPALPGSLEALRANFTVARSGQPSPLSRSSAQHEHSMEASRELPSRQPMQSPAARLTPHTASTASAASRRVVVAKPADCPPAKPYVVVYTGLWTVEQLQQHQTYSDKLWLSEDGLLTLQESDVAQVMTTDAATADTLGLKEAEQLTVLGTCSPASPMLRTTMCRDRVGAPWKTVGLTQCCVDDLSDIIPPSKEQFITVPTALQEVSAHRKQQAAEPSPWCVDEATAVATQSIICSDQELPSAFSFGNAFMKQAVSTSPDTPTLLRSAPADLLEQHKAHPAREAAQHERQQQMEVLRSTAAPPRASTPVLPRKPASQWLRVHRGDTLAVAAMLDPPLWSAGKLSALPAYLHPCSAAAAPRPRGGACAAAAGPMHAELGSLRKSSEPAMHHPRGLLAQLMC